MKLALYVVLVSVLLLQSCASPKHAEELQQGKTYFENGDFKAAFHQLLPVAVAGNAQAEYAMGYMYFNGYGVSQDTQTGLFWMQKAADQHYAPAIKALAILKKPASPASHEDEPIMPHIEKPLIPKTEKTNERQIHAKGYGLQLFGAYDLDEVKKVQAKLSLPQSTVIWHAEHNDKDWYVLIYGSYTSVMSAKLAMDKLPPSVRSLGPWVRKLDDLG